MKKTRLLPLALGVANWFLPAAAIAAPGAGVSVSLEREIRGSRAVIRVFNPGGKTSRYRVVVLDKEGQEVEGFKASPLSFTLGRGRDRRVRLADLPPTSYHLCAETSSSPSLVLRSCAPHKLR